MRDERRSSCKRLSIDAAFRSMKAHGHPFSVTVDALIGARFPPPWAGNDGISDFMSIELSPSGISISSRSW